MSNKVKEALEKMISAIQAEPQKAEAVFEAEVKWVKNMQSEARIRDFPPFKVDVPSILGGDDQGPASPELFLTSIGTCYTAVLAGFAAMHEVKIESINVSVKGHIDFRGFLGIDEKVVPGLDDITVTVKVISPEEPKKVKELLDAAEKMAPVVDTLTRHPEIKFEKIINDIKL